MKIERRWGVVTGATGTIGRACVDALSTAGLGVWIHGRQARAVNALVDELNAKAMPARSLTVDFTDPLEVERAALALTESGRTPAVVINAVGEYGPLSDVADITAADWMRLVTVNLMSPLALIRPLVPVMRDARWGRIIQVSSAAALASPRPGNAGYSGTKAAMDRILGHMATELVGTGVTVHSFHPGEIASRMWRHIRDASAGRKEYELYAEWARRTGTSPDSTVTVTSFVESLLDDAEAERRHGRFSWAQEPDRAPQFLGGRDSP